MRKHQQGVSLKGLIIGLSVLGFLAVMAGKLLPYYAEYCAVKKMLSGMESGGDLSGTVRDIRQSFDRRNAIEDVKSVRPDDLEITKEGGQTVVTANWSVRVPLVANVSACIDFMATTAK